MRILLALLVAIALLFGIWFGGETLISRQVSALLAENPAMTVTETRPLRDPSRVGVTLVKPTAKLADGTVWFAPQMEVWASPVSLNVVTATLAPEADVTIPQTGQTFKLGIERGVLTSKVSPFHNFKVTAATAHTGAVNFEGRELLHSLAFASNLVTLSFDSPQDAGAAYSLDFNLSGLEPLTLASILPVKLPEGQISAKGNGRVWLREPISADTLAAPAAIIGVRADDLMLNIGDLNVRVMGRLQAGADNLTEGEVMLYTQDASKIIDFAVKAGAIPERFAPIAKSLVSKLDGGSQTEMEAPLPDTVRSGSVEDHSGPTMEFPPAARGEIRIPLAFADGRMSMGPIPLGNAPRFPM